MHEMTVAQSLVEAICEEARKRRARPLRAKISCGELNSINDEVLSFAFEAVAEGGPCAGMQLQIEHKRLQARCRLCGSTFTIDLSDTRCHGCGGSDFDLLPDAPLLLEEIEFAGADDEQG